MAYFLRQSTREKGIYLQVYDSLRDPESGNSITKSYKTLGYVHELIAKGIEDPVDFYKKKVAQLNKQTKEKKRELEIKKIEEAPIKNFGYFLPKAVLAKLDIRKHLKLLTLYHPLRFDLYNLFEALVCSRIVHPCSKLKTYEEVIPSLFENDLYKFKLNQVYEGLDFLGSAYPRIIEMLNYGFSRSYKRETSTLFFDCTNFFFEIDKEDELRRNGVSKENRMKPIVSMGLLLDANQIPLAMKLFPGNESEKPIIREVIAELKNDNNIKGRTVQVADKGLNCAQNILEAFNNGDGYIFSQSIKMLPKKEKVWVLSDNDYRLTLKNGEVIFKIKSCIDKFPYTYTNDMGESVTKEIKQKRIVFWSKKLADKKKREIKKMIDKGRTLNNYYAKKKEYGAAAKYFIFEVVNSEGELSDDRVIATLNMDKVKEDLALAGYNMLITSEINMSDQDVRDVYHNLWKIEESFRIMKSNLDARPVFLSDQNKIFGHFLVCYTSVLILRILQYLELENKFKSNEIFSLIRGLNFFKEKDRYINLASPSNSLKNLNKKLNLKLENQYLKEKDLGKIFGVLL